ncbi:uncharacterized protein ACBR49_020474 [Aulostomus maculatus]
MWAWQGVLCVCVTCALALDSNTIRASKDATLRRSKQSVRSHGNLVDQAGHHQMERSGCSNQAQRRLSSSDRHRDGAPDRRSDITSFNRTKGPEMSNCVRSGDCASGLCCVRYLMGKRCQRIPVEGEACLLRGSTKLRRKLGRCDCGAGLSCVAVSQPELGRAKRQGVCTSHRNRAQHSGKKRRTAERSC